MPYNVAECVKDLCMDEMVQAWVEQQEATWMYGCLYYTILYYSTHAYMYKNTNVHIRVGGRVRIFITSIFDNNKNITMNWYIFQ